MPILRLDQGLGDPVALATWHEALSDALAADVPHDLLGLWLYPREGGAVLLGPEALLQDDLAVPLPAPQLEAPQLALLDEIVRDAGYGSAVSLPIRFGRRDAGLLLMADLRPDRYGESEVALLHLVAQRLAPSFGRMARQWGGAHGSATFRLERIAALLEAVAQAGNPTTTPQLLVSAVGRALEPLLPHDRLELLLADDSGERFYRLGEHSAGPAWSDPSLVLERGSLDLARLADPHGRLLLPDAGRDSRWPRGYFTVSDPAGAELRAVAGGRATGPTRLTTWLLAGSVGPDLYDEQDAELLERVGGLIAAHVALLVERGAARESPPAASALPGRLIEISGRLAVTDEPAEATRKVAEAAGRFLPFDEMRFALRLSEGDRVVLLDPGERRAVPDLPSTPVAGTGLGRVLQGELPHLFTLLEGEARLIVPLRVAGRVHGALVFTAAPPAVLNPAHLEPAQRLADLVAPHLELLRRAALLPPPFRPGWKRERKS